MPKLIDLFVEQQDSLYDNARYPYKDDGDTQPYRYTTLDNAEPMNSFFEDQSNPISLSARRDFNRMFQFNKSTKGLIFLGKQAFLQTGNTFAQTRLYNPLNVQLHSVPFIHLPRHVDVKQTIQSLFGGSSDPERYARLQKQTSDEVQNRADSRAKGKGGILNLSNSSVEISTRGLGSRLIDTFTATVRQVGSGFSAQFTNPTLGENERPEIDLAFYDKMVSKYRGRFRPVNSNSFDSPAKLPQFQSLGQLQLYDYKETYYSKYNQRDGDQNAFDDSESGLINKDIDVHEVQKEKDGPELTVEEGIEAGLENNKKFFYKKYLKEVKNYMGAASSGQPVNHPEIPVPGMFLAERRPPEDRADDSRYYKDMTQQNKGVYKTEITNRLDDTDSIDVLFTLPPATGPASDGSMGDQYNDSRVVRFRAFIQDINESVTPTYNENKYIGRYETFYTYDKVIRDVSFTLTLQAFSKKELDHIRGKMNWLTSLAYPEKTNNYLTPTIFTFTIGNVYSNQPAILQSLTHTIDNDASWDIDNEHPMSIETNLSLRLLDKIHYTPGQQSMIYGGARELDITIGDLTVFGEGFNESLREEIARQEDR